MLNFLKGEVWVGNPTKKSQAVSFTKPSFNCCFLFQLGVQALNLTTSSRASLLLVAYLSIWQKHEKGWRVLCTVPLPEPKSKMLYTWWIWYWGDLDCQVYLITAIDYRIKSRLLLPSQAILRWLCLSRYAWKSLQVCQWPWNFGFQFKQVGKVLTPQTSSRVEICVFVPRLHMLHHVPCQCVVQHTWYLVSCP